MQDCRPQMQHLRSCTYIRLPHERRQLGGLGPFAASLELITAANLIHCGVRAGPDAIKEALAKLGLKTGGTLRQRAERLFLTRDTPLAELDRKNFVKGAAPASLLSPMESARQRAIALEAALLEAKVNVQAPRVDMHYQLQQDACLGLQAGCVACHPARSAHVNIGVPAV